MEIRQVEALLFHADGQRQRDITKQTVAFRIFANAPKNVKRHTHTHARTHAQNPEGNVS
jgi:hypothetical protein